VKRRARWGVAAADLLHPALGRPDEVIAAAEPAAVPRQGDHVDLGVEIRLLDAGGDLTRHPGRDAVAPLRPVERDPGNPPVALEGDRLQVLHAYRWEWAG
jgi:hypothetical protein